MTTVANHISMWYLLFLSSIPLWGISPLSWHDHFERGRTQLEQGLYRDAITEYEDALLLADSPQDRGVTLYSLALAEEKIGELALAEQHYKEARNIFRSESDFPRLGLTLAGLGELYRVQHRLDDALRAATHAFTVLNHCGEGESREAANSLLITGEILRDQHRWKAADQFVRRALAIFEKTVGTADPDFAMALNNLGVIAAERKQYNLAGELLTRALRIREVHFGPEHPLIASTLLSLSSVYLEQKRYAEADQSCRRSLELMLRFLPADHPDLIKARIILAQIARRRGGSTIAVAFLEEGAQIPRAESSKPSTLG